MTRPEVAGLFPGQGSQRSEMRERVAHVLPELLAACIELVGEDPFARVGDGTRFAQPSIFCASLVEWRRRSPGRRPAALAGHSLGELTALVAAGVVDELAGLRLAVLRGRLMDAAAAPGAGGMLAVLDAPEELPAVVAEDHGLVVANDNAPGQVVLAGPLRALEEAAIRLRGEAMRAVRLDVAGAFHSPAMAGAVEPFRAALELVELRPPRIPVISCSTAAPFVEIREELAAAIVRPVRWRATMLALAERGADMFLDFGPGDVLARLAGRNLPEASVVALWRRSAAAAAARPAGGGPVRSPRRGRSPVRCEQPPEGTHR